MCGKFTQMSLSLDNLMTANRLHLTLLGESHP